MLLPPQYLYGVLGMPLAQSLSPALHTWGFARSGHPGAYFAWEKSADDLPAFFAAVRSLPIAGLSVTIPHKQTVIPFLDQLTQRAQAVGAVNLIYWQGDRLVGDNTDVAGFLAPLLKLRNAGKKLPGRALLLGTGGAGRAALAGLRELGLAEVWIAARNAAKAEALARDFGCQTLAWDDREQALADLGPTLVINATPLGMTGTLAGQSPLPALPLLALPGQAKAWFIYDIVYNPVRTPLLVTARERGMTCIDGLDFFVAQAREQFRLWTGVELSGLEARELLLDIL
ncbi:MAG: shikimate dehydrogenase [Desulfovibrionaceae bacterium]|nr:shikimate dehydrogenase [Desulfovibrionaceae bacterium]